MKRLNVFITKKELEQLKTEYRSSGMFLSGGMPMGNPEKTVSSLGKKYNMPSDAGIELTNGEFVSP